MLLAVRVGKLVTITISGEIFNRSQQSVISTLTISVGEENDQLIAVLKNSDSGGNC